MSDAKIIPFPKREESIVRIQVSGDPAFDFTHCNGIVHIFKDMGEPCLCGKETWPEKDAS